MADLSVDLFDVFVEECVKAQKQLGMSFVRVSYMFDVPDGFPPSVEAGSLLAEGCGKAVVFLNPASSSTVSNESEVRYLAWHEMVELLLSHRLKMFASEASRGKFDRAAWERRVHEVVHSLIGALKPDLVNSCLLYTSPSPRDRTRSRMPSSA